MAWDTVYKIQDSDPLSPLYLNRAATALENRTNTLKAQVDASTQGACLSTNQLKIDTAVTAGSVVYYDSVTGTAKKALARWSATGFTPAGDLLPAQEAVVTGVVVSKTDTTSGLIVMVGIYQADNTLLTALFGSVDPVKGVWYLSSSTAGTLTATPAPLAVPVVVYHGGGTIEVRIAQPYGQGHNHKEYTLEDQWLAAASFPSAPSGATFGYETPEDIAEILNSYENGYAVFVNGALADRSSFFIDSDNIWCLDETAPASAVRVFLTTPFVTGHSIVRAVRTGGALTATAANGTVTVSEKPWTAAEATTAEAEAAKAVVGISERVVKTTTMVRSVVGIGDVKTQTSKGVVTVSLATGSNYKHHAAVMNLNAALRTQIGAMQCIRLQSDTTSSVTGQCQLPDLNTELTWKGRVFAEVYATGEALPAINVAVLALNSTDEAGEAISTVALDMEPLAAPVTVTQGYKYTLKGSDTFDISTNGTVLVVLSLDSSAVGADIITFGVIAESEV